MRGTGLLVGLFLTSGGQYFGSAQEQQNIGDLKATSVSLQAEVGAPVRVYLTKRFTKKLGEPVHAKVLEPVYSFDRQIIPAGSDVEGHVTSLKPVSKYKRASTILGGDFTPLRQADVEFTLVTLPDARRIAIHTDETIGLNSIYSPPAPSKKKAQKNGHPNTGVLGMGKQQAMNQINNQINARTHGVATIVRGPDKKERLEDFIFTMLPWHPQWVRKGTRFDAELREAIPFGPAAIKPADLAQLGAQPPSDSIVQARLITPLSSGTAKQGEKVEAIVSHPLFSADNKIIVPEGAHVTGTVTLAHNARWFHRGGRLRFAFERVDLPDGAPRPLEATQPPIKIPAVLDAAEASGKTPVKVDQEGGAQTVESKTRFIGPAIAGLIAAKSMDNDAGRQGTNDSNGGARTLAGASGFGLIGTFVAQSSHAVSTALGFYGLAWSVYSNIVARGDEVRFDKNAAMDIRFGSRPPAGAAKFQDVQTSGSRPDVVAPSGSQ